MWEARVNGTLIREDDRVRATADLGWCPTGPPAGGPHVPAGSVGIVREVSDRGFFIRWETNRGTVYRLCDFKKEAPLLEVLESPTRS